MAPREGVVVGHRTAAVLVVLSLARARLAVACLARVDGLRPDDVEAGQQVLRRGPQDGHADATHHTSARARDASVRVLPPEWAMVARRDGTAEALDERGEGLVDLAVERLFEEWNSFIFLNYPEGVVHTLDSKA